MKFTEEAFEKARAEARERLNAMDKTDGVPLKRTPLWNQISTIATAIESGIRCLEYGDTSVLFDALLMAEDLREEVFQ